MSLNTKTSRTLSLWRKGETTFFSSLYKALAQILYQLLHPPATAASESSFVRGDTKLPFCANQVNVFHNAADFRPESHNAENRQRQPQLVLTVMFVQAHMLMVGIYCGNDLLQ